jgi:hypothetical protein
MTDALIRDVCGVDPGRFNKIVTDRLPRGEDLPAAGRRGLPLGRVAIASPPIAPARPALFVFGRWLLDAVVISFAHGGCIHHTHPDYIAFLRDINSNARR